MTVVPEGVPPARAVLAGTVETAVNALWDAGTTARRPGRRRRRRHGRLLRRAPAEPLPGDRRSRSSTSIPAGPRSPPRSVSTSRCRRRRRRSRPGRARQRHVRRAPAVARPARAGGHGDRPQLVRRQRGPALAGRRVSLAVASASAPARSAPSRPARGGRRTTADRLALALELLRDPAFDALVTGQSRFGELPDVMARLAAGSLPALCHTITYDGE